MRRQDFSYHLPEELIAYEPAKERTGSRLLYLNGVDGSMTHLQFPHLVELLLPGDVIVFNDTKVIPARVFGQKATGGKVELLVERVLTSHRCLAHIKASKSPKPGADIHLGDGQCLSVVARHDSLFELASGQMPILELLDRIGHIPLPPYIDRGDTEEDQSRYQTVFGRYQGAVAAPTAGLHFDEVLLEQIRRKGIEITYVTLHVGAGTFQPMRVDEVSDHVMHSEWMTVSQSTCDVINRAKSEGRRVVAVGTTSVRSLETAANAQTGELSPYEGETDIFIYPGYHFAIVDALVTNFHLSESTLLMLVSAFAGYRHTMAAYQEAIQQSYRFFSYGDAMFISRNPAAAQEKMTTTEFNRSI